MLRPEERFLFRSDKKSMYLFNLSVFRVFRGCSCCQAMGFSCQEQLGAGKGPHPTRDACMLCPPPCCCLEQPVLGKCAFVWFNMLCRDIDRTIDRTSVIPNTLLSPGLFSALELSRFPGCPIYQDGSHQEGLGALRASHSW